MKDVFSHPGIPLIQHLSKVANNSKGIIEKHKFGFSSMTQSEKTLSHSKTKILADTSYIIGAVHDFGKATTYFQHYLLSEDHKVLGPKNHALISSLLAHKITVDYLANQLRSDSLYKDLLPFFAYTSVKRHHGNLNNFEDELSWNKNDILQEQIKVIDPEYAQNTLDKLLGLLNFNFQWDVFSSFINDKEYYQEFPDFYIETFELGKYDELSVKEKAEYFYLHQLLYSSLLFSDKEDVILNASSLSTISDFNNEAIKAFRIENRFDRPKSEIDKLKNEAYHGAIETIENQFSQDNHFYSITLPTGLGKTITSLAAAIAIKKKLDVNSRIIISIPFTSIIDQNFSVYDNIFNSHNICSII